MATVSSRMVLRLVQLGAHHGLDGRALAAACGVDGPTLDDPDGRIDVEASHALVERLAALSGDPMLGLRLAFTRDPSTYDVAGLVLLAAPSLRTGLRRAFQLQTLWGDGERFWLEHDAVGFDPGGPPRPAHAILTECAFFETLLAAQLFGGPDTHPVRASFRNDAPAHAAKLSAALGCPVRWGARRSSLELPPQALDAPAPPHLAAALDLGPAPEAPSCGAVASFVDRALVRGDASIVAVARAFGLSPRTLQRRLSAEGATFERIVDARREALARSLLRKGIAVREISALLGYGDRAAFYRAFRRWAGATPEAVRAQGRAEAAG